MILKTIKLKKGKEESLKRNHPWVFSGAIAHLPEIEAGEWVSIVAANDDFIGCGHYSKGSIAVRMLSRNEEASKNLFYHQALQKAIDHRKAAGVFDLPKTNTWRLVFGEGDNLPGLVIDQYGQTLVIQAHTDGMHKDLSAIVNALKKVQGLHFSAIYNKSAESLQGNKVDIENGYLLGNVADNLVFEYGHQFFIDWEKGQKTGFFIDQRENRRLLGELSHNKKVLNAFCYTGGFSVYALDGGAREVHSVDISAKAMELTDRNVALGASPQKHKSHTADVFDFLKQMDEDFDIVVLDPPAFAKSRHTTHNAVQGYKRINAMALKKMKPGSLLFTFSCSQNISAKLFEDTVRAAAIEIGKPCRIIYRLTQPADHPVNIYHPEGEYLKGLVLVVG